MLVLLVVLVVMIAAISNAQASSAALIGSVHASSGKLSPARGLKLRTRRFR